MYKCIHISLYIYVYIVYTYIYIVYIYNIIYIYISCVYIYTYCVYIYMYTFTYYTDTHPHACMHACIHAYIHTYMHTYMHTYIHAYIHPSIHPYIHTLGYVTYCYVTLQYSTVHYIHYIQTDGRTDGPPDRWTDRQTYIHDPSRRLQGSLIPLSGAYNVSTLPWEVAAGDQRSGRLAPGPGPTNATGGKIKWV